jgi:hypothetical protein
MQEGGKHIGVGGAIHVRTPSRGCAEHAREMPKVQHGPDAEEVICRQTGGGNKQQKQMKKYITTLTLVSSLLFVATAMAADKKKEAKPYPLQTCVVTDEKLGEHGKPYVFTHEGQEVKLCCKDCLKDFKKEPAKYTKKIEDAQKK